MRTPDTKGPKRVPALLRLCRESSRALKNEAKSKGVTRNLLVNEILRERYSLPPLVLRRIVN